MRRFFAVSALLLLPLSVGSLLRGVTRPKPQPTPVLPHSCLSFGDPESDTPDGGSFAEQYSDDFRLVKGALAARARPLFEAVFRCVAAPGQQQPHTRLAVD